MEVAHGTGNSQLALEVDERPTVYLALYDKEGKSHPQAMKELK